MQGQSAPTKPGSPSTDSNRERLTRCWWCVGVIRRYWFPTKILVMPSSVLSFTAGIEKNTLLTVFLLFHFNLISYMKLINNYKLSTERCWSEDITDPSDVSDNVYTYFKLTQLLKGEQIFLQRSYLWFRPSASLGNKMNKTLTAHVKLLIWLIRCAPLR